MTVTCHSTRCSAGWVSYTPGLVTKGGCTSKGRRSFLRVAKKTALVWIFALAPVSVWNVQNHPFELCFYNSLMVLSWNDKPLTVNGYVLLIYPAFPPSIRKQKPSMCQSRQSLTMQTPAFESKRGHVFFDLGAAGNILGDGIDGIFATLCPTLKNKGQAQR